MEPGPYISGIPFRPRAFVMAEKLAGSQSIDVHTTESGTVVTNQAQLHGDRPVFVVGEGVNVEVNLDKVYISREPSVRAHAQAEIQFGSRD